MNEVLKMVMKKGVNTWVDNQDRDALGKFRKIKGSF